MKYLTVSILFVFLISSCSVKKGTFDKSKDGTSGTGVEKTTDGDKSGTKSGDGGNTSGNGKVSNGQSEVQKIEGHFNFRMAGYKGVLSIENKDGLLSGTIVFHNWGNGVPHPLRNFKVNGNRIYFKRSMQTREELQKYGGTTYFSQDFYGIFSDDFSKIKGYYRYLGAQDNWEAQR